MSRLIAADARLPRPALAEFLHEVMAWNPRLGLVSKRSTVEVLERLAAESTGLCDLAVQGLDGSPDEPLRVVDIGSGGGFPGVIGKLLYPRWEVLLVERRERRAAFLERLCSRLSLPGLQVYGGDAAEAGRESENVASFDLVLSLAVGPPAVLGGLAEAFLRPGGVHATTVPRGRRPPARTGTTLQWLQTVPWGGYQIVSYRRAA